MEYSILEEYGSLLARNHTISTQLKMLPVGYISQKTIKGKVQYYLQRRVEGKMTGAYIRAEEVQTVRASLERRKSCEKEKKQVEARLGQLEQAAKLIGQGLYCRFMVMKLSAGMDDLGPEQRKHCTSFASAMNEVEGVMVSAETAEEIQQWHLGEKSFQTIFESTLRRYGFPTEGVV